MLSRTVLFCAACALALAGCGGNADAEPSILAAFYPLAFAAAQVAPPGTTVTNLTPAGAEPHDLELTARDIERVGDVMLVYEALGADSAQVLSSERPGRRAVRVRATDKAVHLIEPAGPSVRVTTLTDCRRTKWKRGGETCVRFGARHAWHFDTLALTQPDQSLARQPSGASTGFCEPWSLD